MRQLLTCFALAVVLGTTAAAAPAASPHFKKGGLPTCTFSGTTSIAVTCTGALAGLGNEDLVLELSVSGFAVYQCRNHGGNLAPGQNRVLTGPATSDTAVPAGAIKNGTLRFTTNPATLTAPETVSGDEAGCPNSNWTGVNPTLTLTDIVLDVYQPATVLIFHCTASSPTGLSSPVRLTCTS
jgi:hypothetical protein